MTSGVKWPETVQINETWINDEGLFVKLRVQGEDIAMLVDTGASVTILSEKFIESLPDTITPIMKPVKTTLITATKESTPFSGQSKNSPYIGTETFEYDVVIANIQNDGIWGSRLSSKE